MIGHALTDKAFLPVLQTYIINNSLINSEQYDIFYYTIATPYNPRIPVLLTCIASEEYYLSANSIPYIEKDTLKLLCSHVSLFSSIVLIQILKAV